MTYKIYKLVSDSKLSKKIVANDMYQRIFLKNVQRQVLEELEIDFMKTTFDTIEAAEFEIQTFKDKLKGLSLTIVPFIEIPYN